MHSGTNLPEKQLFQVLHSAANLFGALLILSASQALLEYASSSVVDVLKGRESSVDNTPVRSGQGWKHLNSQTSRSDPQSIQVW